MLSEMWKGEVTKVFILSVIIGAFRTMTKNVQDNLDNRFVRNIMNPK
jgi:hypothetical protein